jgi:hydrogenase expression/formation protein HypE
LPTVSALPEGKLPIDLLRPMLDTLERGNLVVPPGIGVDVGVTRTLGRFLVSSSDPITGTRKNQGWHGVNVSANDVATSGIMPDTLSMVAMFPRGTKRKAIMNLIREINDAAKGLGIAVSGGHTEITPGLAKPIIVVTCFGSGDRFVTAAHAKSGDSILATKTAGIEGTAILSNLPRVKKELSPLLVQRGANLIKKLSIVKDARVAFSTGLVHAMHDVTEGGIIGAVYEMSLASNLGFSLNLSAIPVDQSTKNISKVLGIDPLKLIGSGSLIIACSQKSEEKIVRTLKSNQIRCTKVGTFLPSSSGRKTILNEESRTLRESDIQDELWPTLQKYSVS